MNDEYITVAQLIKMLAAHPRHAPVILNNRHVKFTVTRDSALPPGTSVDGPFVPEMVDMVFIDPTEG